MIESWMLAIGCLIVGVILVLGGIMTGDSGPQRNRDLPRNDDGFDATLMSWQEEDAA